MKLTIKFSHYDSPQWPCCASTYVGEEYVCKLAESWEESERLLLEQLKARRVAGSPPEPKEVEIQ